jgi:small-conductance mechanosensitive channel
LKALIAWWHDFITNDFPLFHIGKTDVTLGQLLSIGIGITLLLAVSGWLRKLIADRLLAHSHVDISTRYTIASLVRYVVLVFGFMAIMETAGINLTAFSVLAGAVGVGIGFGLQNIVSNFISGLIVMFERPVRIGDRIELGDIQGDVVEIGARATRIMTADHYVVIMPNQKFITDPVKNWADPHEGSPLVLNIAVEKTENLRKTTEAIRHAVEHHPAVLKTPPAQVWLTGISGNPAFKVLAWTSGNADARNGTIHELYLAISDALGQQGVAPV